MNDRNEADTRAELIDPALRATGWGVVDGSRVRREVITLGRLQGAGIRAKQEIVDYVMGLVNTLMQPNLSIKDLRVMPIPLSSLREQQRITDELSTLRDETHRLESIYQRKLAARGELKTSLLHQGFNGTL